MKRRNCDFKVIFTVYRNINIGRDLRRFFSSSSLFKALLASKVDQAEFEKSPRTEIPRPLP